MKTNRKLNRIYTSKKGASVIILIFSLIAILGLSSFVIDLGLILNQRYELQKAVESAALLTVSEYELYETEEYSAGDYRLRLPDNTKLTDSTTGLGAKQYKALKELNQMLYKFTDTEPTITFNRDSRAIMIEANAEIPTHFIYLMGIKKISVPAKAAAVAIPAYLSRTFPKPTGSILRTIGPTYQDTDIRQPVGSNTQLGAVPTGTVNNVNADLDKLYGMPDGKVVSLGPGGYVTIKLPSAIYDGKGIDFAIYERGYADGYFVFAGIDADPTNPYINAANPGGGINWINVSCTGIPLYVRMDDNEWIGTYTTTIQLNGAPKTVDKFYGSGLFDLGARCTDSTGAVVYDGTDPASSVQIKNVKYLKIIDDNVEDGFLISPRLYDPDTGLHPVINPNNNVDQTEHAFPMIIPGEHSMITPGADIDAIEIRHHARLISTTDFATDTDGDLLIDVLERIIGTDPNNVDSDGDGQNDMFEWEGDEPGIDFNGYSDTPQLESVVVAPNNGVSTLNRGYLHNTEGINAPYIIIEP